MPASDNGITVQVALHFGVHANTDGHTYFPVKIETRRDWSIGPGIEGPSWELPSHSVPEPADIGDPDVLTVDSWEVCEPHRV